MPSMNPSSAPFLTLGGIRLRRKPRPVRVSSLNRGLGHTDHHHKAQIAPEASRTQQLQQGRLERLEKAGRPKASRKKGPLTSSACLDQQNDMLDCGGLYSTGRGAIRHRTKRDSQEH